MLDPDNVMVLINTTTKVVTTIEVILMTEFHEDNHVLKLVVKVVQNGWLS